MKRRPDLFPICILLIIAAACILVGMKSANSEESWPETMTVDGQREAATCKSYFQDRVIRCIGTIHMCDFFLVTGVVKCSNKETVGENNR